MSRKRILAVTPRLPFPPIGGEKIKTYHSLNALSQAYEVDWFSLHDGSEIPDKVRSQFEQFKLNFRSVQLFTQPKARAIWQTGINGISGRPLQVGYFHHQGLYNAIQAELPFVDGAVAFLIRTAGYLDQYPGKKILDMTDSISNHYFEARKKTRSIFWKQIYSIEAPRLRRFEEKAVQNFDASFFVNGQEALSYAQFGKSVWLPLGVSKTLFQRERESIARQPTVSFLGKMNYQPNIQAVKWFCEKVLPRMGPEFRLYIVGSDPSEDILNLAKRDNRVFVTGFVDDPFAQLLSSWLVIAPLQIGGGIQNKVLEAMALGCPVLMTSMVAKPLNLSSEVALVHDDPEAWVEVLQKMKSGHDHESMGKRARQWMGSWGSWDDYERKYILETSKIFGSTVEL